MDLRSGWHRLRAAAGLLLALFPRSLAAAEAAPQGPPPAPDYEAFGKSIEKMFQSGDAAGYLAHFDAEKLFEKATAGLNMPPEMRRGFVSGARKGWEANPLGKNLIAEIAAGGSFRFLRIRTVDGETRAVFRFLGHDGGLNYHEAVLDPRAEGIRISDLYIYASGEMLSQSVRSLWAQTLARSADSKKPALDTAVLDALPRIPEIQKDIQEGRHRQALEKCARLPPPLQKSKAVLLLRLMAAAQTTEEDHLKAIGDFEAQYPGDPSLDLVSFDGLFIRKKFAEALKSVDRLEKRVGGDPYLQILRASCWLQMGKVAEAKAAALRGAELEPDLTAAHSTLVKISLQEKAHADTARLLERIEKKTGQDFGDLSGDPAYADFLASPEYGAWIAARPGPKSEASAVVLAGGAAGFEIPVPRWRDYTLEEEVDHEMLDAVSFRFYPDGAWLHGDVPSAQQGAEEAIGGLRKNFALTLKDIRVEEKELRIGKGTFRMIEASGTYEGTPHRIYGAAVPVGRRVARLRMECQERMRAAVEPDFLRVLEALATNAQTSKTPEAALPLDEEAEPTEPDAALSVLLRAGSRVAPADGGTTTLAVSPDGRRAILRTQSGCELLDTKTAAREPLPLDPPPLHGLAWSPDGGRIAYSAEDETTVVFALLSRETVRLPVKGTQPAFTPSGEELLLCVSDLPAASTPSLRPRRLESVRIKDGARKRLVEFPLCRVARPCPSPDGSRIALAANRDYPRSAAAGGHLYVCDADGSNLLQLTRDPEEILSTAWSADGRHILAVRRLSKGKGGAVGFGGAADLYRVDAKTGEAENLTRTARIAGAWPGGSDVLLEIKDWTARPEQRGLFRLPLAGMEKESAALPLPPIASPDEDQKKIGRRVLDALGVSEIREGKATPEAMERAAGAFAEAAGDATGTRLDFSLASLDRFSNAFWTLTGGEPADPAVLLGAGAYYGETLRRGAGAGWRIRPGPLGEILPAGGETENGLVVAVLPFTAAAGVALGSETYGFWSSDWVSRTVAGRDLLLVYPPSSLPEVLEKETDASYRKARKDLDAGEVETAIDALVRLAKERPANVTLLQEVIELCDAAGRPEAARALADGAIERGQAPADVLVRRADPMAADDPKEAIALYRKALEKERWRGDIHVKLGKAYDRAGRRAIAESCWRMALRRTWGQGQEEVKKLLAVPPAEPPENLGK